MSLEAIIEANTAAVRDLIAAINAQTASGATVSTTAPAPSPKTEKAAKASAPAEKAKEPAAPAPAAADTADADGTDSNVTYQDAAKAVTDLAKTKGRAAAEEVLKQFGASKLPEVKPEDFAAVVKACKEAAEA